MKTNKFLEEAAKLKSISKDLAELAFSVGADIETFLPMLKNLAEKELDERIKKVTIPIYINGKVKGEIKVSLNSTIDEIKEEAKRIVGITTSKSFIYLPFKLVNFVM